MCKEHKTVSGYKIKVGDYVFHHGFGKLRKLAGAVQDMKEDMKMN